VHFVTVFRLTRSDIDIMMELPEKVTNIVKVKNEVDSQPGTKEELQGTKLNPVSCFSEDEVSSRDELSKACFSGSSLKVKGHEPATDSSKVELSQPKPSNTLSDEKLTSMCSFLPNGTSIPINVSTVSRVGRDNQRWEEDPKSSSLIRLTTGTIPITKDGRVLLISSARKKEWILPKGGWELDESLEQSAIRETYEEAGMLGILGQKLSPIVYETRKAKKRRTECLLNKYKSCNSDSSTTEDVVSLSNSSCGVSSEDEFIDSLNAIRQSNMAFHVSSVSPSAGKPFDNLAPSRTQPLMNTSSPVKQQITTPVKSYTGVNLMSLFPLYITEILNTWPESGRARKIVTIDQAIDLVNRQELKTALEEVRKRKLNEFTNVS